MVLAALSQGSTPHLCPTIHSITPQPSPPNRSPEHAYCRQPYRPDLAFARLKLENIHRVLEVNQIGLNDTLFLHHDGRPAAPETQGQSLFLAGLRLAPLGLPLTTHPLCGLGAVQLGSIS